MIAETADELDNLSALLEKYGVGKLSSILKYKNVEHGWYIIADKDNFKEIYDFVCQYPLTTVSLFDHESANTVVVRPDYKHFVIVLIERSILKAMQKNLDLIGRTGMAYRIK